MTSLRKKEEEKKVIDATVIDEAILMKATKDYLEENKIIPKGGINFGKLKVLSLSFLNIWKIQYLDSFVRLEKLQLDNNIIQRIENIGHLVNLNWLDLSFNRITEIEGLDKLVNLTDLSLYNNCITQLDGLQNCARLNIFSIGNNCIKSFEEIIAYFGRGPEKKTRFKYLQVLNVYGNPFTLKDGQKDGEYEFHLVAHLPNLRYLDYVFIDDKRRKEIREFDDKFKTEDQAKFLQELRLEEQKEREQEEEKRKKELAKMHLLDGFSEEIIKIDDLEKIQKMRGLEEEIQKFTVKVKQIVETMQKKIKDENERKLQDLKKSEQKLLEREKKAENDSVDAIQVFEKDQKASYRIFENQLMRKQWQSESDSLRSKIAALKDKLLNIEIELLEDASILLSKEINQRFEEHIKKITSILNEESKEEKNDQVGYFKKIDDEIKQFGIQLQKIVKEEIERFANMQNTGEGEQEYAADPQLYSILQNRDTVLGTISTIKELLMEKKSKRESEMENELCVKDKEAYKKQYEDRQYERNRKNVKNIHEKIDKLNRELDQYLKYGGLD